MAFEGLNFDVGLNARPFTDGIKTMQTQAASFDNTVKQIGRTLMGVFGAVSVVATIKKSISLWGEQETAMMKLSIAAQRFSRDAQKTYNEITKLSTQLQRLTGIGDETTQELAALGLNLGVASERIVDATQAATLMNMVVGVDSQTAMRGLTQTLQGQVGVLSRYIPEISTLTEEQLRNGEAIDLINRKYGDLTEQLSHTTQVGISRFKAALGDVGEVLGKTFNPLIQKAAGWMEDFSSKIEKPTDILKTLNDTIKAGYEELGPFGKAVVGVGAAFLTLKVAGAAWSLLSQIVVTGGHLIVGVFKTIFSWPTLLIAGLYTLRVAWDHDWFGMQETVEHVWGIVEPIFVKLKDALSTAVTWTISLIWGGFVWGAEKVTLTYQMIKDWVIEELALGKSPLEIVVDVAKIAGGVIWSGLKWIGEKIALGTQIVFDWVKSELGDEIAVVANAAKVFGAVIWRGFVWVAEQAIVTNQMVYDFALKYIPLGIKIVIDVASVVGSVAWDGLKWAGEKITLGLKMFEDWVRDQMVPKRDAARGVP